MVKKEMIAMLLAGGQGSRLGVFTSKVAKPAVAFGGKYRIIDFPLSNCINSGVDTVGVLTQYQPLRLNTHIGIGIPWDLDRNIGGVTVLPPYEKSVNSEWYTGTANAIYQNLDYMESYNPEYVLIGLDESFAVSLNDVDLCVRAWKAGYVNVFTPFAELYHFESISRGLDNTGEKAARYDRESEAFRTKWKEVLEMGDPYYNVNFSLDRSDFALKI